MPLLPLAGFKVLELGIGVGPSYVGRLLQQFGAEVTKVEREGGDRTRRQANGALFEALNLGKTVLGASEVNFACLVADADVVIEALPVRSYDEIADELSTAVARGAIVASLSAYGRTGPFRDRDGLQLQAVAGSVAYRMGDPNRSPLIFPTEAAEYVASAATAAGILLAILAKRHGAGGQHVDVSIWDTLHVFFNRGGTMLAALGPTRGARGGARAPQLYPWVTLACADGYVNLCTLLKKHWDRYVGAMGHPEVALDPHYDVSGRLTEDAKDELDDMQRAWFRDRSRAELAKLFEEIRVPFHTVNTIGESLQSEHLRVRRFFTSFTDSQGRMLRVPEGVIRGVGLGGDKNAIRAEREDVG